MKSTWHNASTGILVLRLTMSILILFHGFKKLSPGGIDYIYPMLEAKGLPSFSAYGVYLAEILIPLMIIFGWKTRPAALIYAFNMACSIYLGYAGRYGSITPVGGWVAELNMLHLGAALTLWLTGPGAYSIDFKTNSIGNIINTSNQKS